MPVEILVLGSVEGQDHAEYLVKRFNEKFYQDGFSNHDYRCVGWWEDEIWQNGECTFNSLYEKAKELRNNGGYAIAMFSPDDVATLRGSECCIGRDNVWLEYGLFSGILGAKQVFALIPNKGSTFGELDVSGKAKFQVSDTLPFHIPSDMGGMHKAYYRFITPYRRNDDSMENSLNKEIDKIYNKIKPKSQKQFGSECIMSEKQFANNGFAKVR